MNQTADKRPESVLVLIYTQGGEVLLLERVQPAGFWQSVTGSLRRDETPSQAAKRELAEETGLDAGDRLIDCGVTNRFPILPAWRSRYAPGVTSNTEYVFRAQWRERPGVRLNPQEHRDFQWLPATAAARLVSSSTNRDAIAQFVPGAETPA